MGIAARVSHGFRNPAADYVSCAWEAVMTIIKALVLAFAALPTSAVALAQEQEIVVRADAARMEIERILDADNLDTARLEPRVVTEIMSGIERGRAPEDFWNAYQLHVQAWANLAGAADHVRRPQGGSASTPDLDGLERAEAAIGTTFDVVERIARQYHARLPAPRVDTRTIA
jgi:hypothetical protein